MSSPRRICLWHDCEKERREKKEGINDECEHRTFNAQRSTSNKENEGNEEEKRYRTPLIRGYKRYENGEFTEKVAASAAADAE